MENSKTMIAIFTGEGEFVVSADCYGELIENFLEWLNNESEILDVFVLEENYIKEEKE